MPEIVYLIVGFIIFAILMGLVAYRIMQDKKNLVLENRSYYKTFFILGVCFLPVGITIALSTDNFAFNGLSALGLIYMVIGLANRDKWEE